jgi:uncharacterized Rossmann fold enzyme
MLRTFTIKGQCAASQEELHAHTRSALARGLPVIGQADAHHGVVVLVGSGPSLEGQLPAIIQERHLGRLIVAVKGAHDWLIERNFIPDFAICADPSENQWQYFRHRHPAVTYLLAAQCHPNVFDHLALYTVKLWHSYMHQAQAVLPDGTPMIGGGTTTGTRAITLFYSMGYRQLELYGYDGSVSGEQVRAGLNLPTKDEHLRYDIVVGDRHFFCTPALTEQAHHFQNLFQVMPDLTLHAHGDGLIPAILEARANRPLRTVSFLHHMGPNAASYRYRCAMPAAELGASINDLSADVLIVSKPEALTIMEVKQALGRGQSVIADFCDDHFDSPHYREMVRLADALTCSTDVLKQRMWEMFHMEPTVIPDPYEFPEVAPHCSGSELLWFGHQQNRPADFPYPVRMVSGAPGDIPWSHETMLTEFARADIVLMPASASYKSANRTLEAIRQGCFVVAEPHPSLMDIPGIWIGDMKEGIEWASTHQMEANERIRASQTFISERYSPRTVAFAWSRVIQACPSTWGQVGAPGPIGSMSISAGPMSTQTSDSSPTLMPVPTA